MTDMRKPTVTGTRCNFTAQHSTNRNTTTTQRRIQRLSLGGGMQEVWGRKSPSGVQLQSSWWGLGDKAAQNGSLVGILTNFDYLTVDHVLNFARFIKGEK